MTAIDNNGVLPSRAAKIEKLMKSAPSTISHLGAIMLPTMRMIPRAPRAILRRRRRRFSAVSTAVDRPAMQSARVLQTKMAYAEAADDGHNPDTPVVFLHGNPTSS